MSLTRLEFRQQATLQLLSNPAIVANINEMSTPNVFRYIEEENPRMNEVDDIIKARQKALAFHVAGIVDEVMIQVNF